MEELPEPVMMEILSRLPVKSLIHFRCVCKHWSSTFKTSYFITKHYSNNVNNNNLNLLSLNRAISSSDISYFSALSTEKGQNFKVKENMFLPIFLTDSLHRATVYGPCNGLFCLSKGDLVAIWNPSTREFKAIPKSTVSEIHCHGLGLGFGFDSTTHSYKVVRFVKRLGHQTLQAELYSLRSDSWKEIPVFGPTPSLRAAFIGCFVNGFYYWGAFEKSKDLILSFDMANEEFSTLPFPISICGSRYRGNLQFFEPLNALLGLILCPKPMKKEDIVCLDLWVMISKGLWTKQSTIELIPQIEQVPLGFWKNNDEIFLQSSSGCVLHFDTATREVKDLCMDMNRHVMHFIPYVESLVSINGRSEWEEDIIRNKLYKYVEHNSLYMFIC